MGVTAEEMTVAIPAATAMAEVGKTAAKVTGMVVARIMGTVAAKVIAAEMPTAMAAEVVAVTVTAMAVERGADGVARMVGAAMEEVMEGREEAAARVEGAPRGVVVRGTVPAEELLAEPAARMLGRLALEEEGLTSKVAKIGKPVV